MICEIWRLQDEKKSRNKNTEKVRDFGCAEIPEINEGQKTYGRAKESEGMKKDISDIAKTKASCLRTTLKSVFILVLLLEIACATSSGSLSGRNFNEQLINNIHEGKTTRQEILKNFGIPYEQSIDMNKNHERFVYIYEWADEQQNRVYTKQLTILFENSVVKKFNYIEKEDIKAERRTKKSNEKVIPLKIIVF